MGLPLPAAQAARAPPSSARGVLHPNSADTEKALGCSPSRPSAGASVPNQQSRGGRAGGKWPLTFRGRHPRPPRKGGPREKREGAADEGLTASSQGKRRRSPELRQDAAPAPLGRPVEVPEASGAPLLFLNSVQTVSRGPLHPNTTCTCMSVLRESCPPGRYCPSTCRSTVPPGEAGPSQVSGWAAGRGQGMLPPAPAAGDQLWPRQRKTREAQQESSWRLGGPDT